MLGSGGCGKERVRVILLCVLLVAGGKEPNWR